MPSLLKIYVGDPFYTYADEGHPNDDFRKVEGLKKSFNDVHNCIIKSMDLKSRFFHVVIDKLEWALKELGKLDDEGIGRTPFFKEFKDGIFEEFKDAIDTEVDKFNNLCVHAEEKINVTLHGIQQAIYPSEANSYDHYINDCHKDKMNEMIVTHLYRQGLFDIGDRFVTEAGDVELRDKMTDLRPQFKKLQDIINAVRNCEIELPLLWVSDNRASLGEAKAFELQFKIHAIKYIRMVEASGSRIKLKQEALNYGRANLTPLTNDHNADEMKMLFACLMYDSNEIRDVAGSRYLHLFDGTYKQKLIAEIERQFYLMMRQCVTDPLSTVVSVGAKFLSGLCKAAEIVKADYGCGWAELGELPLYVDIDEELKFHSHFACPLMKVLMVNGLDPPVALGCGHVISFQTMLYNSASFNGTTICPFCLTLTTNYGYKAVYF